MGKRTLNFRELKDLKNPVFAETVEFQAKLNFHDPHKPTLRLEHVVALSIHVYPLLASKCTPTEQYRLHSQLHEAVVSNGGQDYIGLHSTGIITDVFRNWQETLTGGIQELVRAEVEGVTAGDKIENLLELSLLPEGKSKRLLLIIHSFPWAFFTTRRFSPAKKMDWDAMPEVSMALAKLCTRPDWLEVCLQVFGELNLQDLKKYIVLGIEMIESKQKKKPDAGVLQPA